MATSSSSLCAAPYRRLLTDLSSELLALILEQVSSRIVSCADSCTVAALVLMTRIQLRDLDKTSVASARCLSRRLEAIATPIVYKTLYLTERIVSDDTEKLLPNLLWNISAYTNHVVARSDLNPEGIRRILDSVQRLYSVKFVPPIAPNRRFPLPVLNSSLTRSRSIAGAMLMPISNPRKVSGCLLMFSGHPTPAP